MSPLADIYHRLDRDHHAFLDFLSLTAPAKIENRRIFVKRLPHAMTRQSLRDGIACFLGNVLDRESNIAKRMAGLRFFYSRIERFSRGGDKPLRFGLTVPTDTVRAASRWKPL